MRPSYLLDAEGLAALESHITRETLFAFDLDGTLAPIVDEPAGARVAEPVKQAIKRLASIARVAVITGRSREDAFGILGFEPHFLIGNHGAEWPPAEHNRNWKFVGICLKWRERLFDQLFYEQGVEIEFKGESVSLHYRKAEEPAKALALIDAAVELLHPKPRRIEGKAVVNLLPADADTKGKALLAIMEQFGLRKAIYVGDDETDEEVFRMENQAVLGIHVGNNASTAAPYCLKDQTEIISLLDSLADILVKK